LTKAFEVHEYKAETLKELFTENSKASEKTISDKKNHISYLNKYLTALDVKTVLVEYNYIDRDYLDDFVGYYARCFTDYSRKCLRFHFFKNSFTQRSFTYLLNGKNKTLARKLNKENYLGFMVVKPLPRTIIGRTCLKTYSSDNNRRYYSATRNYNINLFGLKLEVESLAFQEQDSEVAACATSALWSAFHGTGMLFHHVIPSPVEITKAATKNVPNQTRSMPNKGLDLFQMAQAIREVGLEPHCVNTHSEFVMKSILYAYLRNKIPVLMGIRLVDTKCSSFNGYHAVTITGFSLGHKEIKDYMDSKTPLKASRIDKIYVHDDQLGPFARMDVDGKEIVFKNEHSKEEKAISISSWPDCRAIPFALLIPLYHKIRIPFRTIYDIVCGFNMIVTRFGLFKKLGLKEAIEWDIFLTTSNEFKTDILKTNNINPTIRNSALTKGLPRFIWRATAICGDNAVLDLLFDATDLEQGEFVIHVVEYDEMVSFMLREVSHIENLEYLITKEVGPADLRQTIASFKIIEWFKKQPLIP